ncbi:MAG: hypothetical protein Roseis2KO_48100 [Roseivirga sp.]
MPACLNRHSGNLAEGQIWAYASGKAISALYSTASAFAYFRQASKDKFLLSSVQYLSDT